MALFIPKRLQSTRCSGEQQIIGMKVRGPYLWVIPVCFPFLYHPEAFLTE